MDQSLVRLSHLVRVSFFDNLPRVVVSRAPVLALEAEDIDIFDEDGDPDEDGEDLSVAPCVFVIVERDILLLMPQEQDES